MWRHESNARPYFTRLVEEILLRVVLALVVLAMALLVEPHIQYITQDALLTDFKRPRRQCSVPFWALVCLIIFIPAILLTLPWLLTKDYIDTTQSILAWTLALTITAIITEILKLTVGRPRPDFFYRCFPDGKMTYAMEQSYPGNWRDIMEGRKSFPSGHSSFSFASLGFLSLWICGKWRVSSGYWGRGVKAVCCALPLVVATVIAVSRICDNRHHRGDVLCGSAIGIVTSYFCYTYYFNPLDSDLAGYPLLTELNSTSSSTTHCSRHLNIADRPVMEFSDK